MSDKKGKEKDKDKDKEKENVKCDETIFLQYSGKEVCIDTVREAIKEDYEAVKEGTDPAKDLRIYLKPEDNKAYYVINDDYAGEVDLNLK
ncbi:MAG: hypothetical protein II627_04765 [Lachnospiraceae bacterium]|nr:hypothetical protein [Lachnospiraceae bacterium]